MRLDPRAVPHGALSERCWVEWFAFDNCRGLSYRLLDLGAKGANRVTRVLRLPVLGVGEPTAGFRRLSGCYDVPARLFERESVNVDVFSGLTVTRIRVFTCKEKPPDESIFLSLTDTDLEATRDSLK